MKTTTLSDLVPETSGPVELGVDEGGVRCDWRSRHAYVPLEAIADVGVDKTLFGGARLVLQGSSGGEDDAIRLDVKNASCVAIQRLLLVALAERNDNKTKDERPLPALDRDERPIEEWLGDVARHAAGGYREVAFDHAVLTALLVDVHGAVEPRAAAAYALLQSGDDEHLVAVTRAFVMHALPPLVLAAAHAAAGGPALVPEDVVREIEPYLPEADVAGLKRTATSNADREARVTAALEQAKELASEEARKEQEASAQSPHKRRLHMGVSGVDTRWVGKTWAL